MAQILRRLWHRRLWVAGGLVLAAVVAYASAFELTVPPRFEPKSIEFGAASTQVLVDAGRSPLSDLALDVEPLSTRAQIYVRLVESDQAVEAIAREAGLHPTEFVVTGRISSASFTRSAREPAAEQRANQVADEAQIKRLLFAAEEGLPVVTVSAQAPTAEEAIRLADAGARGLMAYLSGLEAGERTRGATRVEFRQLGPATGGQVNSGASKALAAVAFVAVFAVWCFLVLVGSNVVAGLRRTSSERQCENCGFEVSDEAKFCPRCGAATAPTASPGEALRPERSGESGGKRSEGRKRSVAKKGRRSGGDRDATPRAAAGAADAPQVSSMRRSV